MYVFGVCVSETETEKQAQTERATIVLSKLHSICFCSACVSGIPFLMTGWVIAFYWYCQLLWKYCPLATHTFNCLDHVSSPSRSLDGDMALSSEIMACSMSWMGTWPWALKSWLVACPGWGHGHGLWNHALWHVLDGDMTLSSEIMACGMPCFCFKAKKNQKLHGAKHGRVWLRTWAFCSSLQDTVTLVLWWSALLWRCFSGTSGWMLVMEMLQ